MVATRSLIAGIIQSLAILISMYFLYKVYRRYQEKKSSIVKNLLLSYSFMILGLIISTIAVFIWSFNDDEIIFRNHFEGIFLEFRIGFCVILIALYFAYQFRELVFTKEKNKVKDVIMMVSAILIGIYNLVVFTGENSIFDTIALGLIFIYFFVVYVPFMTRAFLTASRITEIPFKKAFMALGYMSLSFIILFLLLVLDSIVKIYGAPDYSIFYFLSQIFLVSAYFTSYYGYIKPSDAGN